MESTVRVENWIYDHDRGNTVRYTLGVKGAAPIACFGINPSTAAPGALDNTLKSVARIAERHGSDGWLMFNVYPQRATNPDDMHTMRDEELHKHNVAHIVRTMEEYNVTGVLAAWGTLIQKRPYLRACLRDIVAATAIRGVPWYHIGPVSKAGHPHHPLYLRNTERLQPFDIMEYIAMLERIS